MIHYLGRSHLDMKSECHGRVSVEESYNGHSYYATAYARVTGVHSVEDASWEDPGWDEWEAEDVELSEYEAYEVNENEDEEDIEITNDTYYDYVNSHLLDLCEEEAREKAECGDWECTDYDY